MIEDADDPLAAARAAGLRYATDSAPGISRRHAGRAWRYFTADGAPIRDAASLARIRAIVIPPAWSEVWINADPRGHIQATGRDARGRKQYRYHPAWRATRDETRFSRLAAFGQALPCLRERVASDSEEDNAYPREIAGEEFTAKDFRTWAGAVLAARVLREQGPAESDTACQAAIVAAVDDVAARLGNTRPVCRASYIHPDILRGYETSTLSRFTKSGPPIPGLDDDECWTLAYLTKSDVETRRS